MAYIKKIKLPGVVEPYDIYDASAIHNLSDIEGLGLQGAFIYKGTVATVDKLPAGATVGWVYHVTADGSEYVWTTEGTWEEFGSHISVDHTHQASLNVNGSATVTGTNEASAVSGSADVTGTNAASAVTGTVSVPDISKTSKFIKATTNNDSFVKSYPGATSKMSLVSIAPAADSGSKFITAVTPTTGSVTGVNGSVLASLAKAGTAVSVAKVGSEVTVATGLTGGSVTAGSAPALTTSVSADGTLSIDFAAGTPTAVTLPTATTTKISPAASAGSITPYTFTDVTVPVAAASATTVVTSVGSTQSTVNAAKVDTAVSVADGKLSSTGTGASVMTGLGTAVTANALTSASLASASSATDGIAVGDSVSIGSKDASIKNGSAAAQVWTQSSGTISGTAAAQTWAQKTGTISGTAAGEIEFKR